MLGSGGMMGNGGMTGYGSSRSAPAIPPTPIGAAAEPVDREIQITASNLRFVPTQVTVRPGEKVRFVITNTDGMLHNFGSDDAGIAYGPLPAGMTQSVVWTAPAKASTVTAVCTLHAGMRLSIVVKN
jgi:plastocyanin